MSEIYKEGSVDEPNFPSKFEVVKKSVLQVTDIKTNKNKYYAIELHSANNSYRVFTHYGRTDDLDSNPNAGARESRYFSSSYEAEKAYDKIYREKTSAKKGYKELALASSKIGSKQSIGQSVGNIDSKTLEKIAAPKAEEKPKSIVTISKDIQDIVSYLYSEATNALTATVSCNITANGIETPLGVLTIGQIDKGQTYLDQIAAELNNQNKLESLSGDFYTAIPHRFGRSKEAAKAAIIDSISKVTEKNDTLQLMRDMLNVNGKTNVLVNPEIQSKYEALNCSIVSVDVKEFEKIKSYIEKSVIKGYRKVSVKNLWKIARKNESEVFDSSIGNEKLLFHGSAIKNWVGILSRGLLLPKAVVKLGIHRTDAGWLGSGIYFGDAACTTLTYAHPGKKGSRFMTVANVALGKQKQYKKITYGLDSPPVGYDSCWGIRGGGSEFSDDEFVVYKQNQQKLEYLVEYTG